MTEKRIREILGAVASGKLDAEAAFSALKDLPFEDLGFAKLDSHRTMRRGVPEVVFGENKTVEQIAAIGTRSNTRSFKRVPSKSPPRKIA